MNTLSELKKTALLAVPLILTHLLGQALTFVDTVMAGWQSPQILASVALGAQIFSFVFLFMVGIAIALTTAVAKYHGANDTLRIRRSFQQGVWLTALLGMTGFLLILIAAQAPYWIGSAPDIADGAHQYLLAVAPGGGLLIFGLAARYFLEGMSYPRTAVLIQIAMIPVNIAGNYLFLKGFWIIPPLGAQGMAIATSLSCLISTAVFFTALWRNPRWQPYRLFTRFAAPDLPDLRHYLRIGLPIALGIIMEAGLFLAVTLIVSRSDAVFTGANQIALNYGGLSFMIPLGLAYALTIRIGNANGSRDYAALRARAVGGLYLAAAVMTLAAAFIFLFPRFIIGLYTDNAAITPIAANILLIVGIFQIVDGLQVCAAGILRGLQDTKAPMVYALIGYWVIGFPFGLLLAYGFGYGIYGLWGGVVAGLACNALLGVRRVLKVTRLPHPANTATT